MFYTAELGGNLFSSSTCSCICQIYTSGPGVQLYCQFAEAPMVVTKKETFGFDVAEGRI